MPVHVETMSSEVTAVDSDLPLSDEQIERLVQIILRRLEQKQRDEQQLREAMQLRTGSLPPLPIVE